MWVAPKLDVVALADDLEPGETVEYMGEVYGSWELSERPKAEPEETTSAKDQIRTSPAAG